MTPSKAITQLRPIWLLSLLPPLIPFASYALFTLTDSPLCWWLGPIYVTFLMPLMDIVIGESKRNPKEDSLDNNADKPFYQYLVFLYPILQWLALGFGLWVAASGNLSGWDWLGWTLCFGIINGYGINAAHEIGHKRGYLAQLLAKLALIPSGYGHFLIEHNRGHHVRVATPEDPASAKLGESFWRFLPRTFIGGLRSAWHLENQRLERKQQSHWHNQLLQCGAASTLLLAIAISLGGVWSGLWLIGQAIHAITLLEVINYVEHYGLKRQRLANGRYEKCSPKHSWNSNALYSNITLFNLQRHSDHHANPTRPYQLLRHFDESPNLPSGYSAMVSMAFIPSLWFRIMDKRVLAHYNGDRSLTNELTIERRPILLNREKSILVNIRLFLIALTEKYGKYNFK